MLQVEKKVWAYSDTHLFNGLFLDNLGKPAPERLNQSGF